jgi:hypothetical protein
MRGTGIENEVEICATNNQENQVQEHHFKEMAKQMCEDM